MKRVVWVLILIGCVLLLLFGWLFWARPTTTDMAAFSPIDPLVYLEVNDPLAVAETLMNTAALKSLDSAEASAWRSYRGGWKRWFLRTTGIGPVPSVILSRAQIAVVITNVGAQEGVDSLTVKPEIAVVIETHTSNSRIRPAVEQYLQQLAQTTYGKPVFRRTVVNSIEFLEWTNADATRRIVASVAGTVVVVGNSEAGIKKCLDTVAGRTPNLKSDPQFEQKRQQFSADRLTFGYVPAERSPQLLSFALPIVMGRAPGDASFQKLVSTGAAKLFGSITWGSKPYGNGIEDRYLISLQPSLQTQLKSRLSPVSAANAPPALPSLPYSVTYYRFGDPASTWEGLKTALSANVDALSAVVFNSLLNSGLASYGIAEPAKFLHVVQGPILTIRFDPNSDRTMVIASIRDRVALQNFVVNELRYKAAERIEGHELFLSADDQLALSVSGDHVVLGNTPDVRRYIDTVKRGNDDTTKRLTAYAPLSGLSVIATYSDDSERVRRFIGSLGTAGFLRPVSSASLDQTLVTLPYAATESRLDDSGVERVTRSPLGQFSTLLPALIPETAPAR